MKISKRMVLSSIVCVLPLVVSALLYRQLPNQMPIHWNSVGEANGFIEKNIGAWGIPLFMLAIHLVVAIKTEMEMSRNVQSGNTQNPKSSAVPVRLPFAPAPTPGTSQAAVPAGCAYRS